MVAGWVDTKTKDALWVWFRPRYTTFIRAVYAYARANPTATGAQVSAYANTLTQPLPGVQNSQVIAYWLESLGLTASQALAWVRSISYDDILQQTDPASGYPVLNAAGVSELRIRGDRFVWGIDRVADFLEHPAVRDAAGNVIEESISGTIDGVPTTVRRTISVALVDGAYVSTPGPWEIV